MVLDPPMSLLSTHLRYASVEKLIPSISEKPKKATVQIFRPRADVLVRSYDGRNLLIVEVKAPHELLDDNVREQGICYARLLRKGGIAPFVILTNGHETKIYDSISEELINGTAIPLDHPHIKAGFRVNVDDMAFRAEALERFISLSPENSDRVLSPAGVLSYALPAR